MMSIQDIMGKSRGIDGKISTSLIVDNSNNKSILNELKAKELKVLKTLSNEEIFLRIKDLIGDLRYTPKYMKMIRDGHGTALLELADISRKKIKPASYFGKSCSKERWSFTLSFLEKCRSVMETAAQVAKNIKAKVRPDIIKSVWVFRKKNQNALIHSITAKEVGKNCEALYWHIFEHGLCDNSSLSV